MFNKTLLILMLLLSCIFLFSGAVFAENGKTDTDKTQHFLGIDRYMSKDYADAFNLYKKAADQGDANAQFNLGVMYFEGKGVPQNYVEAFNLFKKAAAQGNSYAQYNLGVGYSKGRGVPINYKKAYVWYILASAKGHEKAKHNISVIEPKMAPQQIAEAQKEAAELWRMIHKK
jgi:uncharacterized protein